MYKTVKGMCKVVYDTLLFNFVVHLQVQDKHCVNQGTIDVDLINVLYCAVTAFQSSDLIC